jgi:hypothetical protein
MSQKSKSTYPWSKKIKIKMSQKSKSTQNQKSTQAQICFFTNFKGKKTHNMNSPHQIEPFNTNFIRFGGLDRCH